MIIGETPTFTLEIPEALGIDLNDAEDIVLKLNNNNSKTIEHKLSLSGGDKKKIKIDDSNPLVAYAFLQRADSDDLKPGRLFCQWEIKMPEDLYPDFGGGFFLAGQFTEDVLRRA